MVIFAARRDIVIWRVAAWNPDRNSNERAESRETYLARRTVTNQARRVQVRVRERAQRREWKPGINSGGNEGLKGWSVKSKQSDAQREIELGERVSLFFINRPIKQGRPPSMFYFVQLLPYLFLSSCCVLSSRLLYSFFSRCRESLCSCLRFSLDSSRSVSQHEPPPPPLRGGAPFVGWARSGSFFAILFNFFARGRNPFITWTRDSSV